MSRSIINCIFSFCLVLTFSSVAKAATFYLDNDGDGYGKTSASVIAARAPAHYVSRSGDCDDNNIYIRPGLSETCNGIDDNCNGTVDENVKKTFYRDVDGDGYGIASLTTQACAIPAGYASKSGDCNNSVASIRPGATEICNAVDDDCDGLVDEGVKKTFYVDSDADGYGNKNAPAVQACTAPSGYVSNSTDCNDASAQIRPGVAEKCNNLDDNCNGNIDEGVKLTFYVDADQDGYGLKNSSLQACTIPASGYASKYGDCDDTNASIRPGAVEVCNAVDDDCDALVDENVKKTFYADSDADGYGNKNAPTLQACAASSGYVSNSTDCNDADASIRPNAVEVCNDKDDNCNNKTDEGLVAYVYYADSDLDGYGNPLVNKSVCYATAPAGYVSNKTDCNDTSSAAHPGEAEVCDSLDNDCDRLVDEGLALQTYYTDADHDGFGDLALPRSLCAASAPLGYASNSTDCNDASASIHPSAIEICDGLDQNCDGAIDEGVKTAFYRDIDSDSFGDASSSVQACSAPAGYVASSTDCNDGNSLIYPGATEVCDLLDNNCNSQIDEAVKTTFYQDSDSDSFGDASVSTEACSLPAGHVSNSADCNDAVASIHPGATELCDGLDQNCDGAIDEGVKTVFYRDSDSDSFGNIAVSTEACSAPVGYVSSSADCDDAAASIHPGATELCDGLDQNCDGVLDEGLPLFTYYSDSDHDGFGDSASTRTVCDIAPPANYATASGDCDDSNSGVHPSAAEICSNSIDENCNAQTDEGCSTGCPTVVCLAGYTCNLATHTLKHPLI